MKKQYESPKAEKMTFDYAGVVVASSSCTEESVYSFDAHEQWEERCQSTYIGTTWTKEAHHVG